MINTSDKKMIWSKLINDLDNDDIVLEIKVSGTTVDDYNKLLKALTYTSDIFSLDYFYAGEKERLPAFIEDNFFNEESIREIKINLKNIILSNAFFEADEIEFYTNSVLKLSYQESSDLFDFIEWLGKFIDRKVSIFVESNSKPSLSYCYKDKVYKTYFYVPR